jgi:hypothetical protein
MDEIEGGTVTEIKWEDPRDRRMGNEFHPIAEALRTKPGQWAVVKEGLTRSRTEASSLALGIRRGKYAAFQPSGQFLARSSKDTVWAAWIGENGEYREQAESAIRASAGTD